MTRGRSGFFHKLSTGWILAVLLGSFIHAQTSGSGTITGSVTDPSGSVVPAASITVKNTDTGMQRKIQTNEAGLYVASFLQPGHYEVGASKPGLTTSLRKDLTLQV